MMAKHIAFSPKYKDYKKAYVFCNTGQEREETISFLQNIERVWGIPLVKIEGVYSNKMGVGVNYKIVEWHDLDMKSKPFKGAIMHMNKGEFTGMPNQNAPFCSSRLKTLPADKYAKDLFGNDFIKAVGFRAEDMPLRITWAEIKHDKKRIFPLITDFEYPITKRDLNDYWKKQPFKLGIDSIYGNCELCWKKSDNVIIANIRKGTRSIEFYLEQEKIYGNTSFRGHRSIQYFVDEAKKPQTLTIDFENEIPQCVCNF